MGYRSDVALAIRASAAREILADPDSAQVLSEADKNLSDDGALLFHWEEIRWDSYDKETGALMGLLADLDYDDFLFIRLGEDDEDTEILGGWWDNPFDLGYVRRIEFIGQRADAAPPPIDLKARNTRPEAVACAKCGGKLSDPVPGLPSMKHCPVCEP